MKLKACQEEIIKAGIELAEYASYAEIVGGISVNREAIRKGCDKIFELYRSMGQETQ